jgi:hypothetical protein
VHIYVAALMIKCEWPWKVPKWPSFWPEVAVKACRDLATLTAIGEVSSVLQVKENYGFPLSLLTEGWSMKFRETKFCKISRKNSFRNSRNFLKCHEILFPA